MTCPVDTERLTAAHLSVRNELLGERNARGSWPGRLSSSPLSTATAISALVLAEQNGTSSGLPAYSPESAEDSLHEMYQGDLSELIVHSLHWLAEQQNDDGGWGDTDQSLSNVATTMLVQAAFQLTGVPAKFTDLMERASHYVAAQGGLAALKRRYAGDKTFVVPILTNCALADMVPWRKVPALPFELACLPQRLYHHLKLPVVSYALPALVAIGQARFHHAAPRNPVVRWLRAAAKNRSLEILGEMQPASGGFLEATPLTSFVVMSLSSMGLVEHPVVRRGVRFLLSSVREDGSWPIDSNLATWNSSQAVTALNWKLGDDAYQTGGPSAEAHQSLDWLLSCQHHEIHRATGAAPGGWAWTDLSGGIPDTDDTAAALLALSAWHRRWPDVRNAEIKSAARAGVGWLLEIQNKGGGWPTFCQGWGRLPFDRSSTDITAHAMRALNTWKLLLKLSQTNKLFAQRVSSAVSAGSRYLGEQQQADGSWFPLWFGNQYHATERNPVYGTAKVLQMCRDLGWCDAEMASRAAHWLVGAQHASGAWGTALTKKPVLLKRMNDSEIAPSIEETAVAVEALLPFVERQPKFRTAVEQGVSWLVEAIEKDLHKEPAPIGFYFAKLWYYERLYPLVFATSALTRARRELDRESNRTSVSSAV